MLGIKFFTASMIHCTEEPCIESLVLFLPEQIVGRLSHHSLLTNNFSLTGLKTGGLKTTFILKPCCDLYFNPFLNYLPYSTDLAVVATLF